jgi:hypothetical protein
MPLIVAYINLDKRDYTLMQLAEAFKGDDIGIGIILEPNPRTWREAKRRERHVGQYRTYAIEPGGGIGREPEGSIVFVHMEKAKLKKHGIMKLEEDKLAGVREPTFVIANDNHGGKDYKIAAFHAPYRDLDASAGVAMNALLASSGPLEKDGVQVFMADSNLYANMVENKVQRGKAYILRATGPTKAGFPLDRIYTLPSIEGEFRSYRLEGQNHRLMMYKIADK